MSNPIITYVEFDDSQVKGQPVKNLYYAEWTPLNDDDSGSGYGDPKDDEEPIPDDIRVALAKIVLPEGYEIAAHPMLHAALVSALKIARLFINDELEKRREGGLDDADEYLKTPVDILAKIDAAVAQAEA